MKKIIFLCLLLCLALPSPARAHVLLHDPQRKIGAVLHVTPDDDPVAGEPSSLVFDIQDQTVTSEAYSFTLQISDSLGSSEVVPISTSGTIISASHSFPAQGLYHIELRADPVETSKQAFTLNHSQSISRGITTTSPLPASHTFAEIGLIASACGLIVLGILFWNNRAEMRKLVNKK